MIVVQLVLSVLALWVLYHLMVWAIPIAAGIGLGYLAYQHGSGWLLAIGSGFLGAVLALILVHLGMACRSLWIRVPVIIACVGPAIWGGSIAVHAMAIQTGAQGPVWPLIAGGVGGAAFGILAFVRLLGMTGSQGSARPVPTSYPPPAPTAPAEPEVVYYHPLHPVRPRLTDQRGANGPIIDL